MNALKKCLEYVMQFFIVVLAVFGFSRYDAGKVAFLSASGTAGGGDPKDMLDKIKKALPDGKTVPFDDFKKQVGPDVTKIMPWAKPDTVTRSGTLITFNSSSSTTHQVGSVQLILAKTVEFDATEFGGRLLLSNIKGIQAKVSSNGSAYDLHELTISTDPKGNIVVEGKAVWKSWLPYVPFKFKLDPNGQPITQP